MAANWFEDQMGFQERSYDETQGNLEVVGKTLRSRINGRSYSIGELEIPSLIELRNRAESVVDRIAGTLKVINVAGDVRQMHRDPANRNAMFQVASQFNLLEMVGPHVSPEDGVTRPRQGVARDDVVTQYGAAQEQAARADRPTSIRRPHLARVRDNLPAYRLRELSGAHCYGKSVADS
jgi:hypothetical protein